MVISPLHVPPIRHPAIFLAMHSCLQLYFGGNGLMTMAWVWHAMPYHTIPFKWLSTPCFIYICIIYAIGYGRSQSPVVCDGTKGWFHATCTTLPSPFLYILRLFSCMFRCYFFMLPKKNDIVLLRWGLYFWNAHANLTLNQTFYYVNFCCWKVRPLFSSVFFFLI